MYGYNLQQPSVILGYETLKIISYLFCIFLSHLPLKCCLGHYSDSILIQLSLEEHCFIVLIGNTT